ncbi:Hypothetical predicted protein, partial [Podarcis lilfordi]
MARQRSDRCATDGAFFPTSGGNSAPGEPDASPPRELRRGGTFLFPSRARLLSPCAPLRVRKNHGEAAAPGRQTYPSAAAGAFPSLSPFLNAGRSATPSSLASRKSRQESRRGGGASTALRQAVRPGTKARATAAPKGASEPSAAGASWEREGEK